MIYCSTNIDPSELRALPGKSGYDFVGEGESSIARMVQNAIDRSVEKANERNGCAMAYLKNGPYGVPVLSN